MRIGDKVWMFDVNRREYRDGRSAPVFREHFYEREITGETSHSWLIGPEWSREKISKKTLAGIYTEQQVVECCWIEENKYRLSEAVRRCGDYSVLKKVDAVLAADPERKDA